MKAREPLSDPRALSRDIVRTCRYIIVIYLTATLLNSTVTHHDRALFLQGVVLVPGMIMTGVLLALEWLLPRVKRYPEYVTMLGVNLLIATMTVSLYELPVGTYLLIFPILISLFYYSRNLILYSFLQQLATLLTLFLISDQLRANVSVANLLMVVSMLAGTALIINNLRTRASALADNLVAVIQEKQDLQTKNILMEKMSRIDPATELYNHRSFHEHLQNIMVLQDSFVLEVHLALIDIDDFKRVNDTYGHATGDTVIRYVADKIRECLEADDFASRYGGEEFAVLSVDKPTERFLQQMESLRRSIASSEHPELAGGRVTVSVGIERLAVGMSKESLFEGADAALYWSKKHGKNRIALSGQEAGGE